MSTGLGNVLNFRNTMTTLSKAMDAMVDAMNAIKKPKSVVLTAKQQQACILRSVDELKPMVRSMLIGNFDKSGITEHSGKMRDAITRADIRVSFGPNKPWRMFILFPNDVQPYVSTTGKQSNPYVVFAAVGHGRVNTRHGTQDFHSAALRAKQARALRNKKLKALAAGKTSFTHNSNQFDVTQPKPFFYLDGGQKAAIQQAFMVAYTKNVNRKG